MSVDGWAKTAIVCLVIALLLALVYLFADKVGLRKLGFFGGITLLVAFLLCNLFAFQQKSRLENRDGAIVMAPSVTVKSTPSNSGTDVFVLHEGTRVDIIDDGMKEWREIKTRRRKKRVDNSKCHRNNLKIKVPLANIRKRHFSIIHYSFANSRQLSP